MKNIRHHEYWTEVKSLAEGIVGDAFDGCDTFEEFREQVDNMLFNAVDGHQWVICYAYNLDVLQHSDNDEYMMEQFGAEIAIDRLKNFGLSALHSGLAFWALYADVQDYIDLNKVLDRYEQLEGE